MEITADDVDDIEAVRQTVDDLIDIAESADETPLDESNLVVLETQLDSLHQALSMVVAQKDALHEDDFIGGA